MREKYDEGGRRGEGGEIKEEGLGRRDVVYERRGQR